jgi:maltooligosyltrehalose trehalohydrolase
MSRFSVWAPSAASVEVQIGTRRIAMRPAPGGWWTVEAEQQGPVEYGFVLDGAAPLPDPRSPCQPCGVHGPSRTVDHAGFRWSDARWQPPPLASAVMYELHVGTFTREGTFQAAAERIGYLRELGVTHVELMPVAEFPGERGWGYDGVDLFAPCQAYGGPHGLKAFVDACHAAGLAVILDVVYNHLGPDGNYLGRFGPYFTPAFHTPWGEAVNLAGPGSDEVRRFFIDNAVMWFRDYHADALRLDAVHAIIDTSATHFLEQLSARIAGLEGELGRHLALIAESDLNDPRLVRGRDVGGYGLSAQWNDDFHHALHALLTGERNGYYADFGSMSHLAKALERVFVYDGCYSGYRDRAFGRSADGIPRHRFVGFLQNHDQTGNRAAGDRSSALMTVGRAKIGAAVLLTAPFIPLLFQGEEWGASTPFQYFTDHSDTQLAAAVSNGRRSEFSAFGWRPEDVPDPQDPATFLRSKLDWSELGRQPHSGLLEWYRGLIRLRKNAPDLLNAETDVSYDEEAGWFRAGRGAVEVVFNIGRRPAKAPLASREPVLMMGEGSIAGGCVELEPDRVAIVGPRALTANP